MDSPELCCVDGCLKAAGGRSKKCWAHQKREQRQSKATGPVRDYGQKPWEHILSVASQVQDCAGRPGNQEWDRALNRLRSALGHYASKQRKQRKRINRMSDKSDTL